MIRGLGQEVLASGSFIIPRRMPSSEIRIEIVPSRALKDNALGDPSDRPVHVILPPGYAASGGRRYPVVFLLAGFGGSGRSFLDYEPWDETLPELAGRLFGEARIQPMILVLPDGMTRFGGSQYLNSPATGRYQDYLLELVEWTDRTFSTQAEPAARAIAGKSSGGFGALRMVLDRPGTFGLVVDHSGDKYFEYCYAATFPRLHRTLEEFKDLDRALDDPRSYRPHDQAFRDLMEIVALSACYSPNSAARHGFDLPIDLETGAVRDEVWQRWREHDPLVLLEHRAEALRNLKLIYLDCGRRDEFHLQVGMRLFHRGLDHLGIPHQYTEHEEGHFNLNYRYAYSLQAISDAIAL